jgi:hypothetical protein
MIIRNGPVRAWRARAFQGDAALPGAFSPQGLVNVREHAELGQVVLV